MDILQISKRGIVRKLSMFTWAGVAVISLGFSAFGQTPSASPAVGGVIGEVKAIDATVKQMIVRGDSGVIVTINLSDKTQYKRMAPGEKTLTGAADITLADVGPGDRVWARWRAGAEHKTATAPQII